MEASSKPPIKHLASCNTTTRDKTLKKLLTSWLPCQRQVSEDDMKKLWKALFYCLWHADKASLQSTVIHRISSATLVLAELSVAVQYFSTFLVTMRREWSGIDHLRLDKFYLLIRRFVHSAFLLLKKNAWDLQLLRVLMGVLEDNAFLADDKLSGNGVNYHIASVFLAELMPFLPLKLEMIEGLFQPFFAVMGQCQDKLLVGKVKSNVFDAMLRAGRSFLEKKKMEGDTDANDNEMVMLGTLTLKMGFSKRFYDVGSSEGSLQGNRKIVLGLHEVFMRLEKDLESSGIEIEMPNFKVEDEEVPKLIPIIGSGENMDISKSTLEEVEVETELVNGSRPSKKSKKGKKNFNRGTKKAKVKNNGLSEDCSVVEKENLIGSDGGCSSDGNLLCLNESIMSNLQMQFEKVAAEDGLDKDDTSSWDSPLITVKSSVSKKRKRARNADGKASCSADLNGQGDSVAKSVDKSGKKVKFVMKNNLVWKPHTPLPPESLRLPPSVTPRGSALKKGVPPGPIREMPRAIKKVKTKKKTRKGIKRLQMLRTISV